MLIYHVDVFSNKPFGGNGLTVVFYDHEWDKEQMQSIACEFKQFETIFLKKIELDRYEARIFTVEEELDFAGHPVLGAAAVIHKECFEEDRDKVITFKLKNKDVITRSQANNDYYEVSMNQGSPQWIAEIDRKWQERYCEALNIKVEDLSKSFPMEVVSTGLPYLLVPIKAGLEKAKICCKDFEALLAQHQAKFVYVFDVNRMEGRTWDNRGLVEDVATGSAAGPMGAYLYKHGAFEKEETIVIHQGQYVGRPSVLMVSRQEGEVIVSGEVKVLMKGELFTKKK